jgi:hypothetical protein
MSGEVKFGRVVDRWAVGSTANVPIMAMVHATGPVWQPTGEVIQATNSICDVAAGSCVAVVDLGKHAQLIQISTYSPTVRGPQS